MYSHSEDTESSFQFSLVSTVVFLCVMDCGSRKQDTFFIPRLLKERILDLETFELNLKKDFIQRTRLGEVILATMSSSLWKFFSP